MQWFVCGKDVKVIEMIFSLKFCLQFYGNLNYLAQKYPTSIQFLLHVRDVVKTQNLKVGQNVPQNLVKISGHPPNVHAFATSLITDCCCTGKKGMCFACY